MRWRVFCAATRPLPGHQASYCWWSGYRIAATEAKAKAKPCPRCGDVVVAAPAPKSGT